MNTAVHPIQIRISAGVFLLPAIGLMVLPLQWVVAIIVAAAVHELCHIAAVYLLGGCVYNIHAGISGAIIETEPMESWKELICAAAGPVGSAALVLLAGRFPRLALCGGIHFLYNCLPLFPLDGGRVLRSTISLLLPEQCRNNVWRWSQMIIRIVLLGVLLYIAMKSMWGVLLTGIILIRLFDRNSSCKQSLLEIQ